MAYYHVDGDSIRQLKNTDYRPDPNGPTYPSPARMTQELRTSLNIFSDVLVVTGSDDRYHTTRETRDFDGSAVVITRASVLLPIEELRSLRKADAAEWRYRLEVGGVKVGDQIVATDRESQMKLLAVRVLAKEKPTYRVSWKFPGGFADIDAAAVIATADAVAAHVQAAYAAEKLHVTAIDALSDPQAVVDYTLPTLSPLER